MVKLLNRKMPPRRTAYGYLALACFLTLLFGLHPTGVLSAFLAISFAAAGVLSIPRITYPKVLLYLFAVGLLPITVVYFLTRAPYLCVATFAIIPATALLVLTIRKRNSRSAGILWTTMALCIILLVSILWWLHDTQGGLSVQLFKELYNQGATIFVDRMTPMLNLDDQSLFMTAIDPQEYLTDLYMQLVLLSPALFVLIIWVGVWLSTVVIRWIFMNYVYGADRFANWPVTTTRPIAWIYISAFLVASLVSAVAVNFVVFTIAIICNNIYLILMPTFVIVGCRTIKERMLKAPGCGCMTIMMLGMLLFALPMLPSLLAFTGAFQTVSPKRFAPPPSRANTPDHSDDDSNNSDNPPDEGGTAS